MAKTIAEINEIEKTFLALERKGLIIRDALRNGKTVWKKAPGVVMMPDGTFTKEKLAKH